MTVEEKVYAILAAGSVVSLVPAERIKCPGDWQNLAAPYIVHHPAAPEDTIHTHDGGLQSLRVWPFYQVSIFASTYGSARSIAEAVITDLDGYTDADVQTVFYQGMRVLEYDTDRKVQHIALDFMIGAALS